MIFLCLFIISLCKFHKVLTLVESFLSGDPLLTQLEPERFHLFVVDVIAAFGGHDRAALALAFNLSLHDGDVTYQSL